VLALTGAASISTGHAPQYLAAVAAGLVGGQAAFQKNALFDKTLPALMAQMAASRQTILVTIRKGEAQGTEDYPLDQGLNDINQYENAGTIPGAISGITSNAGAQLQQATDRLNSIQVVTAAPPELQPRREALAAYVKTPLSSDQLKQLLKAIGKTPSANDTDNLTTILLAISDANTVVKFNVIGQQVKLLFGRDF
jgi:hypothetical protein